MTLDDFIRLVGLVVTITFTTLALAGFVLFGLELLGLLIGTF